MQHTLYFISHPEVDVQPAIPVPDWSLSEKGIESMKQSLAMPWVGDISAVYSSTEKKAIDGAGILAHHLGLTGIAVAELGENDRSSTGFLPPAEFEIMADKFFAAPEVSIAGWERACDAQNRIITAIRQIDNGDSTTGSIAIVSHGAVGTLLYCALNNKPIDRQYDQPGQGGGNYLVLQFAPKNYCKWWQSIS